MKKIGILASGNGTNAENIARYFADGDKARVAVMMCNRKGAGVFERMARLNIPSYHFTNSEMDTNPQAIIDKLEEYDVDLVVLAGFMHLLPPALIERYRGRILNIHPSLLPKYGGKGMYGHHVHEAVVAAGEKQSGVTVHWVDEKFDNGGIVMQESVDLEPGETAESLEDKIHPVEYSLYPRAIEYVIDNELGDAAATGEVDSQWAKTLHMDYDPERAAKAAERRQRPPQTTPPPMNRPGGVPPQQNNNAQERKLPDEPMPNSYMVLSVLSVICCCLVTGIIAIIYSAKVSSKYYAGDLEGARRCSRAAQGWIIASFCIGVLWSAIMIPVSLLGMPTGV